MQKWEYKIIKGDYKVENEVKKLGEEGWELVAVAFNDCGNATFLYFKRPKN